MYHEFDIYALNQLEPNIFSKVTKRPVYNNPGSEIYDDPNKTFIRMKIEHLNIIRISLETTYT